MNRGRTLTAVTAAVTLGFAALAAAANPPNGVYQGIVDGSGGGPGCGSVHNEGEGYFRVKNGGGGKQVAAVGTSGYCGGIEVDQITAPSDFHCNQLNAALTAKHIALTGGAFDYTGKAPIGPAGASRNIRFKGSFANGKFAGFTRIKGGGCDSGKVHWHMKKVSS